MWIICLASILLNKIADDTLIIWHFIWIVCLADDSHEMPSLIFSEK